jgi:alanine-synthesizing transaminase
MRFSERTGWDLTENEWTQALREARNRSMPLLDLTVSNPTACGLGPQDEELLAPLANPGAAVYSPDPLGMRQARDSVAAYYGEHGVEVPREQICLTTSTSEAYSFLFRLLCDPGDEVLIARPSYPLFDLLAQVDDVRLRSYPLLYEPGASSGGGGGWWMDLHALEQAITPRTRAVIVVHPNNPTGNYVRPGERAALRKLCAERGVALIVDEVFLDYAGRDEAEDQEALTASFAGESDGCLCFVLSGLSKVCALPQMKLSWIVASGPAQTVRAAMARIEVISDTFLSVNAPVQFALSHWLAARGSTQQRIRERMAQSLDLLDRRLRGSLGDRLALQGGWTAVLRVPGNVDGEEFAMAAMRRGVLVQPGAFYGMPAGRCVVSLLTPPETWKHALPLLPV